MTTETDLFWEDLAKDLRDPEFMREYVRESIRIGTIDHRERARLLQNGHQAT